MTDDTINHPAHYTAHPSGVECIAITEHLGFCIGNVIKYAWRAGLKGDAVEDLKKARWYLNREIERRTAHNMDAQDGQDPDKATTCSNCGGEGFERHGLLASGVACYWARPCSHCDNEAPSLRKLAEMGVIRTEGAEGGRVWTIG